MTNLMKPYIFWRTLKKISNESVDCNEEAVREDFGKMIRKEISFNKMLKLEKDYEYVKKIAELLKDKIFEVDNFKSEVIQAFNTEETIDFYWYNTVCQVSVEGKKEAIVMDLEEDNDQGTITVSDAWIEAVLVESDYEDIAKKLKRKVFKYDDFENDVICEFETEDFVETSMSGNTCQAYTHRGKYAVMMDLDIDDEKVTVLNAWVDFLAE